MTAPRRDLTCPACGHELSLEALFADEETRQAVAGLMALATPLGNRVLAYLSLFHPPKNRLTLVRKIKLVMELLPDLQRGAISHKGAVWQAPPAAWIGAIEQMLQLRDQARLQLPLTGHGYLYAILAGAADKSARLQENDREEQRRHRTTAPAGPAEPAGTPLAPCGDAGEATSAPSASRAPQAAPVPGTSPLVRKLREELAANRKASPSFRACLGCDVPGECAEANRCLLPTATVPRQEP